MRSLNHKEIIKQQRKMPITRETYHHATCARISKKGWNDLVRRYGLQGDEVRDGKVLVAYRRVREMTEQEKVFSEGRG